MDRRTFLAAAAAGGATLAISPVTFGRTRTTRRSGTILAWEQPRDGVHVMVDPSTGGNAMVVASNDGAVLVDAKFPFLGDALRRDAMSLTDAARVTLINTHHHADHTGGNAAFSDDRIFAHENALPRIAAQLDRYVQGARGGPGQVQRSGGDDRLMELATAMAKRAEGLSGADFAPSHAVVGEKTNFDADGLDLHMRHFGPGHTDNDMAIHLPALNVIHTGDLVFNSLHPYFDPPGGATVYGWIRSLERVQDLCDKDTLVIPGHGPVGDRGLLDAQIEYHRRLIDAVQADIDAGVPKEQAQEKAHPFMEGLGFGGARARAIGAVYDELKGG